MEKIMLPLLAAALAGTHQPLQAQQDSAFLSLPRYQVAKQSVPSFTISGEQLARMPYNDPGQAIVASVTFLQTSLAQFTGSTHIYQYMVLITTKRNTSGQWKWNAAGATAFVNRQDSAAGSGLYHQYNLSVSNGTEKLNYGAFDKTWGVSKQNTVTLQEAHAGHRFTGKAAGFELYAFTRTPFNNKAMPLADIRRYFGIGCKANF